MVVCALACADSCPDVASGGGLGVEWVPAVVGGGVYELSVNASETQSVCLFQLPDLARLDCNDDRVRLDVSPTGSFRGFVVAGRHELVQLRLQRDGDELASADLEPSYESVASAGCGASFEASASVPVP